MSLGFKNKNLRLLREIQSRTKVNLKHSVLRKDGRLVETWKIRLDNGENNSNLSSVLLSEEKKLHRSFLAWPWFFRTVFLQSTETV